MPPSIAPTTVLIRYLDIFRRWFLATNRYAESGDQNGLLLSAWIADALHNVPSMLYGEGRVRQREVVERLKPLWTESLPTGVDRWGAESLLTWLVGAYQQPWRYYHTLAHVERMFTVWQEMSDL